MSKDLPKSYNLAKASNDFYWAEDNDEDNAPTPIEDMTYNEVINELTQLQIRVKHLQAENAALRERLDKAVELKEPYLEFEPYGGMCIVHYKKVIYKEEAYDNRAAAEKRLAELGGER